MTRFFRRPGILAAAAAALFLLGAAALVREWRERPPVSALGWPVADAATETEKAGRVTVTWLGITTLLFDDGETQILTDGTFTRLGLLDILARRRVWSDAARINEVVAARRLNRLAAIVPLHAHFDHAMDLGHVANRTSAIVLGSESAANIARGARVPVSQYQILADGESRQFGAFTITLIESAHAPIGPGGDYWFAGAITEPLEQPARVSEWKAGIAWSVIIAHPQGTALVQGSGGFVEGKLAGSRADVVFLSVAGLAGLGQPYVARYWSETVGRVAAGAVYPIHFDDFTQPPGTLRLFPERVDDVPRTAGWILELATAATSPARVQRLPLGRPVVLYP